MTRSDYSQPLTLDFGSTGDINLSFEKSETPGNYNALANRPRIEGVLLEGDKTFPQLGLNTLTVQEIEKILYLD